MKKIHFYGQYVRIQKGHKSFSVDKDTLSTFGFIDLIASVLSFFITPFVFVSREISSCVNKS
jgi:hypothetical protein